MRLRLFVALVAGLVALAAVSVAAAEMFRGTQGDDVIIGTFGNDRIHSFAGHDTIDAEGGDDRVHSGPGRDRVIAGGGNDLVRAGDGEDDLGGGAGNDLLRGQKNDDTLTGADGDDHMWPGSGQDAQYGGEGNDRLHALADDNQPDLLDCGPGDQDVAVINRRERRFDRAVNCERVRYPLPTPAQAASEDDS